MFSGVCAVLKPLFATPASSACSGPKDCVFSAWPSPVAIDAGEAVNLRAVNSVAWHVGPSLIADCRFLDLDAGHALIAAIFFGQQAEA